MKINIFFFKDNNFYLQNTLCWNKLKAFNGCWLITPPNNLGARKREIIIPILQAGRSSHKRIVSCIKPEG